MSAGVELTWSRDPGAFSRACRSPCAGSQGFPSSPFQAISRGVDWKWSSCVNPCPHETPACGGDCLPCNTTVPAPYDPFLTTYPGISFIPFLFACGTDLEGSSTNRHKPFILQPWKEHLPAWSRNLQDTKEELWKDGIPLLLTWYLKPHCGVDPF